MFCTSNSKESSGVLFIIYDDQVFLRIMVRALSKILPRDFVSNTEIESISTCLSVKDLQQFLNSVNVKNQIKLVIIQAEFGKGERYKRRGIQLLESLRRDWRLLAPVIIMSLGNREKLAQKYPIIHEQVPGSYFIEVPFELSELKEIIITAKGVPPEQLRWVVTDYCHIEDSLARMLHDIINAIRADKIDIAIEEHQRLKKDIVDFLPCEFYAELRQVDEMLNIGKEIDKNALSDVFFNIREALHNLKSERHRKDAVQPTQVDVKLAHLPPPEGFEYILVVDDDGYDSACQSKLEDKGYVVEIITSYREALRKIDIDPPDVLLCDLRLEGDPKLGRELVKRGLATPQVKLVFMISIDEIDRDEVPAGVEICAGRDKFNTELIHALICTRAGM